MRRRREERKGKKKDGRKEKEDKDKAWGRWKYGTGTPEAREVVDTSLFQETGRNRLRDRLQQLSLQRGTSPPGGLRALGKHTEGLEKTELKQEVKRPVRVSNSHGCSLVF